MIRRIFTVPEGNEYGLAPHQVLVTFNETTGVMHVAHRLHEWETWTRPCEQIDEQDEPVGLIGTARTYPAEGRVYDPQQYVPSASAVAEAEGAKEWHDAVIAAGLPVASPPDEGGGPDGPMPDASGGVDEPTG